MPVTQMIEVGIAAALIVAGALLYRRRGAEGRARTGSQTAVILIFIGLILAIHGLGLLEYRPSESERIRATQ